MKKNHVKSFIILFFLVLFGIIIFIIINIKNNKEIIQTNEINELLSQIEITSKSIDIKEKMDIKSKSLGKVYCGEIYTIINKFEENKKVWYQIKTINNISGYILGNDEKGNYVKKLEIKEINIIDDNIGKNQETLSNDSNEEENVISNDKIINNVISNEKTPSNNISKNNSLKVDSEEDNTTENNNVTLNNEIIDATYIDECPEGYVLNSSNSCFKRIINAPIYTCDEGYVLENNICVGETRELIDAEVERFCDVGNQKYLKMNDNEKCSTSIMIKFICPTDYVIDKEASTSTFARKCRYKYTGKTMSPKITCANDDTLELEEGIYKCYNDEIISKGYYKCSYEYSLEDNKCYKK